MKVVIVRYSLGREACNRDLFVLLRHDLVIIVTKEISKLFAICNDGTAGPVEKEMESKTAGPR